MTQVLAVLDSMGSSAGHEAVLQMALTALGFFHRMWSQQYSRYLIMINGWTRWSMQAHAGSLYWSNMVGLPHVCLA